MARRERTPQMPGSDFRFVISETVDDLLMSIPGLNPAEVVNQAIDELTMIDSDDCVRRSGRALPRIFRLTPERLDKIRHVAADTGMSEKDVTLAAIRQFARNHPTAPTP